MAQRQQPNECRGPHFTEHLMLLHPHIYHQPSTCDNLSDYNVTEVPSMDEETSQESEDGYKKEMTCNDDVPTTETSEFIEIESKEQKESNHTSPVTLSSLNEETTDILQQLHYNKMECVIERKETPTLISDERYSKRTQRTVNAINMPQRLISSRKSRRQRTQNLDTCRGVCPTMAMTASTCLKEEKVNKGRKRALTTKCSDIKTYECKLSCVQEKKKMPSKRQSRKARRSGEPFYSFEIQTKFVSKLIAELYQEQEKDDRDIYSITKETVLTETKACERSQEVRELSLEDFRRLMTYGEVSVESVASTILPLLNLDVKDVFFDLGCGTGKILVQAALQTPCKRTIGIELMQNRVLGGHKALTRLKDRDFPILQNKQVEIYQGDIFVPPEEARLMDATVVFVNNVMFGPQLMLKVMQLLKAMPKLRCVMTLRKICERHGHEKCSRAGNYCVEYVQPPIEQKIDVSWADKASIYFYESVDYKLRQLTQELANGAHQVVDWYNKGNE